MRILFLVPYTPTPIRTRPYNLLRGLLRRGHKLTLATLWENEEERDELRRWQEMGVTVLSAPLGRARKLLNTVAALPSAAPLQARYCWQPRLAQMVESELRNQPYDIIHIEHLRGARYGLALKSRIANPKSPIPIVWDSVDCISHLFAQAAHSSAGLLSRAMTRFELGRTQRYEAWLLQQFAHVLVTSPVDRAAFERLTVGTLRRSNVPTFQRSNVLSVLPNGVDTTAFTPGAAARDADGLVFSGKMSYHANITAVLSFARETLPLIWAQRPKTCLTIVGQRPSSEVQALARDARITVTGSVPLLQPYLQRAAVAVAPMSYGAGIQNKVLEAMACATPVVATPQAVSALHVRDGEHLLVADGPDAFAQAVLRLLDDDDLRQRLGQAGRRYVEERHNWDDIVQELESIYSAATLARWNVGTLAR